MARPKQEKTDQNKMTVYLDNRSVEEEEREITEQQEQLARQKDAAEITAKLFWHLLIAPVVFFLLWNSILTSLFGLAKIGYLKSLGILLMAHLLRGSKNE
jgi:hypothetical protein